MFKSVVFYTNKIKPMKRFYMNVLSLDIVNADSDAFTVKIGETEVTFKNSEKAANYHYAINIPGNQFSIMKDWIQERVKLLIQYGKTEIFYNNLGADSMYFEDPAGNLVELIGRRNRDFFGPLTKEAFYDVSEVGISTPHMTEVGDAIQDIGIPVQQRTDVDPEALNFLGKDDYFIVLVPPEWKWEFSGKKAEAFPLEMALNDGHQLVINAGGEISISKEK